MQLLAKRAVGSGDTFMQAGDVALRSILMCFRIVILISKMWKVFSLRWLLNAQGGEVLKEIIPWTQCEEMDMRLKPV